MTDCKRQLSSIDNRRVAQCTISGITWSVWIADRGRHDLAAEDEVEVPWPSKLAVYATMTGRKRLKNYALRIEKVPDNWLANGQLDEEVVHDRLRSEFSMRCEIFRRNIFREEEKMYFPIQSPADWINEAGDLAIVFKVRPLDYRQKCLDQEVYLRSLMGSKVEEEEDEVGGSETDASTERDGVVGDSPGSPGFSVTSGPSGSSGPSKATGLSAPSGSSSSSSLPNKRKNKSCNKSAFKRMNKGRPVPSIPLDLSASKEGSN